MKRLQLLLLALLIMMPTASFQVKSAAALPFDHEITDQSISGSDWVYWSSSFTSADTVSGYLETDDPTQLLTFFICNSSAYTLWAGGGSPNVYDLQQDVHTLSWSFDIPYSGTWYLVFANYASTSLYVDIGIDVNGDNTPYYSTSTYNETGYGIVLEADHYYTLSGTMDAGTKISGHFSTFFTTDGVDFFICDEANFNIWKSGGSATVYSSANDYHQSPITSFTVPTTGVWYLVWSTEGKSDAVTLSYGVILDTSGVATGISPEMILLIGGAAVAVVLLVVCVVCSKRRKPGPSGAPSTTVRPLPGGSTRPAGSQRNIVKGALKSYPRVSMAELAQILEMDEDSVRDLTLQLIAAGEISGTFDKTNGEFISKDASMVGRELRDSEGILKIPRCPNCGAPLAGDHVIGDRVQCDSCGMEFTV